MTVPFTFNNNVVESSLAVTYDNESPTVNENSSLTITASTVTPTGITSPQYNWQYKTSSGDWTDFPASQTGVIINTSVETDQLSNSIKHQCN